METKLPKAPLVRSLLRWMLASVNSWVHFIPLFVVCPFSRRLGGTLYQSWVRKQFQIFCISVLLHDENHGKPLQEPKLYVWLNQSNIVEGAASAFLLAPCFMVINLEYALMPLAGMARMFLGDIVIIRQWTNQAKRGIEPHQHRRCTKH